MIELVLMVIEVRKANEMFKLGIGIKKLTEEERRTQYGKKLSILSLVTMGLFMVFLIVAVASVKPENRRTVENVLQIC